MQYSIDLTSCSSNWISWSFGLGIDIIMSSKTSTINFPIDLIMFRYFRSEDNDLPLYHQNANRFNLLRIDRISFGIILNFLRGIFYWFIIRIIDSPRYFIIRKLKTLEDDYHYLLRSIHEKFCHVLALGRRIVTTDIGDEFSSEVLFVSRISLVQTKYFSLH